MRLITTTLAALFIATSALADERSQAALTKLSNTIRSYTSYRVDFTARTGDQGSSNGTLTVSGQRFNARIMGSHYISDGTTLWNYTPSDREVTIEHLDPRNASVLSNPSRLMGINPNDYNHTTLSPATAATLKIELTPKVSNPDYRSLTLECDPSGQVSHITINTTQGDPIQITVNKITPNVAVTIADFSFDTQANKGVEVIDFRQK